jgi:diguanylate cyclase (GGDEF)-like protein
MIDFRIITLKALATGIFALGVTLLISVTFVPMMGGKLAGAGLIMTIICPLASAIPMSALHYWNTARLRLARKEAAEARDELAVAYEQLRMSSRLDPLTGILNRATFMDELEKASLGQKSGGLLFFDLDYFKTLNDTYGHATGDAALRRVGQLVSRMSADDDIAGRIGGEEFAMFLPFLKRQDIIEAAEKIRVAIANLKVTTTYGDKIGLSASFGVAYCETGFDPSRMLQVADANMYSAKRQGRNLAVS